VTGFTRLREIGGGLYLLGNPRLVSLAGLDNVRTLGGDLAVQEHGFRSLHGLSGLRHVHGSIDLYDAGAGLEPGSGLAALRRVDGDVRVILGNITSAGSFPDLREIGGSLTLLEIDDVVIDGFHALRSLGGDLQIDWAPDLTRLSGFSELREVGGGVRIHDALGLIELDAFDELHRIGGAAVISGNEQLRSLDSLLELESIGGSLIIAGNYELQNLDELARLTSVGGNLVIRHNYSLPRALAHALHDQLLAHGFSGAVDIFRNGDVDDGHD
jgi:hypothetical protein